MNNIQSTIVAPDRNLDYQKVNESLTQQLKDYLQNNGLQSGVVGVSGGIDSAVVSTLMAQTELATVLVTMPIHQAIDQVTRADQHIAQLIDNHPHITHHNIDLTQTYDIMKEALMKQGLSESELYLALVNTRSRLRMAALYALANTYHAAVIGTGNKVEDYGIGFFTKHGDGGVDYSPIGNLLKSEVYKLGETIGVMDDILCAKPTDGLHPDGATDEDQIGATYNELEWAMAQYDNYLKTNKDIRTHGGAIIDIKTFKNHFYGRHREVIDIYLNRHLHNAHKMQMPPVAKIPLS